MSQVNYDAMSDTELKQYFLQHRQDQAAFQAYLDRLNQRSHSIIASPGDPDFDEKIQAAIRQKLEALRSSQQANNSVERRACASFRSYLPPLALTVLSPVIGEGIIARLFVGFLRG